MKFLRLRLSNIGPFYGHYDFDLMTLSDKTNVILFGGQNGSGKTTILESMRLGLFGPLAYGFKTETPGYFEKINAKFNTVAKSRGENSFRIIVDIEMIENFSVNHYTINRSWQQTRNGSLKGQLNVHCNERLLNDQETEIFQERIREENPPDVFELCLFDGEQAAKVLSDESLPSFIKNAARVMFNLDLFENMESDLNQFIKQEKVYNDLNKDERQLQELTEHRSQLSSTLDGVLRELDDTKVALEEKRSVVSKLNKEFDVFGGLMKEKRHALISEMDEIEHKRRLMMEDTKNFITTLMPFALVKDLLQDVREQMALEYSIEIENNIQAVVTTERIREQLNRLKNSGQITSENLDSLASVIRDGLVNDIVHNTDAPVIHRASYAQRAEVESVYRQIEEYNTTSIIENFKENAKMIKTVQTLRNKIVQNDSSQEIRELLDTIHKTESETVALEHKQLTHETTIETLRADLVELDTQIDQLKSQVIRSRKAQNVFAIATRVMYVSVAFRQRQLLHKLQAVELQLAHMLQLLYRKDLFIVRVQIDPSSFQLKLYDSSNQEINKDILSAAEKQILLLSTVWAMMTCSNRRLPFVFDTLLGRLDQTHKKSLIQHLLPQCGEQVIILATDSEVDEEHFKLLKPITSRTYTIDYDSTQSKVAVSNDFFNVLV